ncbi:MAG: DnaJ domain-containing protein [Pseudomonadota bacterium]
MLTLGTFALVIAVIAAGWLLFGAGRGNAQNQKLITLLKAATWFGLAGALFAAKLFPLALMLMLAAGGVTAIETWRDRAIGQSPTNNKTKPQTSVAMTKETAARVLGVAVDASAEDIKSAHRRLISQMHPDHGGSDFLAAQINEARALLLKAIE